MLALSVLLEIFYREIENNLDRKKQDIVGITKSCITDLKIDIEADIQEELIQRFVDGLLWSGQVG